MGFETPKNLAGESKDNKDGLKKQIKDIAKIATLVSLVGGGAGADKALAGGIRVDETVLGNKHEIPDVITPGIVKESIKPGIVPDTLLAEKITTTEKKELSRDEQARIDYANALAGKKFKADKNGPSFIIPRTNLK